MDPVIGGALITGAATGIGGYLSAREDRKAKERELAVQMALKQRENELAALQNTNREYDTAYSNMIGVARDSLRY